MSTGADVDVVELLVDGLDDWVSLHDVVWHGRERVDGFGGDVAAAVRAVVTTLITDGLAMPGDLGDVGLDTWAGGQAELIERVLRQCQEYEWNPQGAGCWFANTAEGDRLARLARDADAGDARVDPGWTNG